MYKAYLDFSGGLNDTYSDLRLSRNEGTVFRNVNLDQDGAVSKRKGSVKHTPGGIGAGLEIGALTYFRPSGGTAELVAVAGTKIVRYSGIWDVLYNTLTNNLLALLVPFKNLLYINNGTDNPLVYCPFAAGAKVWRAGEPQPATHPSFNANIAGAAAPGVTYVRVRYVGYVDNSFVGEPDSEDGTAITIPVGGGVRINIPIFAGADFRVAKRVIERTKVGDGIFFIDGYVGDNVTATYDIVSQEAAIEGNPVAPDLGSRIVPGKLWPFCLSRNRIVGWNAVTRRVEWSTIDEFGILPEAFPAENYVFLDITDGEDEPVACLRFADQVIFYCGRSIHRVYIDDGGQGATFRLDGWEIGIPSPRAAIEVPGGHLVWTYKGPHFFNGESLEPIGKRIRSFARGLEMSKLQNLYIVHRYDRRQVKFVVPSLQAVQNDQAAVYHYQLDRDGGSVGGAWTIHDSFRAKSGCIGRDVNTKQDVEYSGDYDGNVRIEDFGDRESFDAEGAIPAEFTTSFLDCDDPVMVKAFTDGWLAVQSDDVTGMTVSWETDFGEGVTGTTLLEAGPNAAKFDTAVFDVARFAGGQNKIVHFHTAEDGIGCVGRHVQFRIQNLNANQPFTVLGLILKYFPDRDRNDA